MRLLSLHFLSSRLHRVTSLSLPSFHRLSSHPSSLSSSHRSSSFSLSYVALNSFTSSSGPQEAEREAETEAREENCAISWRFYKEGEHSEESEEEAERSSQVELENNRRDASIDASLLSLLSPLPFAPSSLPSPSSSSSPSPSTSPSLPPSPSPFPSASLSGPLRPLPSASVKPLYRVDVSDVTQVSTEREARHVLSLLMSPLLKERFHAIDTEVARINAASHSPHVKGYITCFTIFVGPDVDFGSGPRLFVDCIGKKRKKSRFDSSAEADADSFNTSKEKKKGSAPSPVQKKVKEKVVKEKKIKLVKRRRKGKMTEAEIEAAEDVEKCELEIVEEQRKVEQQAAELALQEAKRKEEQAEEEARAAAAALDEEEEVDMFAIFKPYFESPHIRKVFHNFSFDSAVFSNHGILVQGFAGDTMHMARLHDSSRASYSLENLSADYCERGKTPMKALFSIAKLKQDGSEGKARFLPPIDAIQRGPNRDAFIDYATFDAQSTWQLRVMLEKALMQQPNELMRTALPIPKPSHLHYFSPPERPKEKRANMYRLYELYYVPFAAMLVDMERCGIKVRAKDYLPEIERRAKLDQLHHISHFRAWASRYEPNAKYLNIASNKQKRHLFFGKEQHEFERENVEGFIAEGKKKPPKKIGFSLQGFGMPVITETKKKDAAVNLAVLRKMCGRVDVERPSYGLAYEFFRKRSGLEQEGIDACVAINSLCQVAAISTMINSFIEPLQTQVDRRLRVHASLNLNTETGRLSCRRPNLQNQPALEKDVYKVRDAFVAEDNKMLIVADYGQLELRLLAHMTACKSMIRAFEQGGDFHSRTAMGMYSHVREAVENGQVALEAGANKGSVKLLKNEFASERRKAKTLNFSIAYGKTARGLAADWNTSVAEAEATLAAWYADRPEVKEWQQRTIAIAHRTGFSSTLMGRKRTLHGINGLDRALRSHLERAAINTPIQGGAADVVMMAMIKLHAHERFYQLGWRAILQIHDEIIAEGPKESTEEALAIVRECMEMPFEKPLLVHLTVDAKADTTWYKAK